MTRNALANLLRDLRKVRETVWLHRLHADLADEMLTWRKLDIAFEALRLSINDLRGISTTD